MDGERLMEGSRKRQRTRAEKRAARALAAADGKCTATAKGTGKRCRNPAFPGRSVCVTHGAKGGGQSTSGRYIQLRGLVGDAYRASLQDPSLVDLRETLSVLDALVKAKAARLAELDTPGFRQTAVDLLDELAAERGTGDAPGMVRTINALDAHLRRGARESVAENELSRAVQVLSLRVEEDWRIRLARKQVINAQDATKIFVAFFGEIRRICSAELAAELVAAMQRVIDGTDPAGPSKIEDRLAGAPVPGSGFAKPGSN